MIGYKYELFFLVSWHKLLFYLSCYQCYKYKLWMQIQNQADRKARAQIESLQKTTNNHIKEGTINLNHNAWKIFLETLISLLQSYPLHAVIALHARKVLKPFLKGAFRILSQLRRQHQSENFIAVHLEFMIQKIYVNAYNCFLRHQRDYPELFRSSDLKKIVQEQKDLSKLLKQNQPTEKIRRLLEALSKIIMEKQNFDMRKELNSFIDNKLLVLEPTMLLEEIALNYIKYKVEIIQLEKPYFLCCRVHFQKSATSEVGGFSETSNQEFKDYRWPLKNESIIFHLTKTFVGFLNTTGGIIYVGRKEDKNKMVQVKGIELSDKEKVDFLYFIHNEVMNNIYPKDPDREQDEQEDKRKQQINPRSPYKLKLEKEFNRQKSPEFGYDYRISTYVSVDFMDVFNGDTFTNSIGEAHSHRLYIARIKIKLGNPRQLYHIINSHGIPQTYLREDKSVKRRDIKEFHELFYKRKSGVEAQHLQSEKKEPHALCRFIPNILNKEIFL